VIDRRKNARTTNWQALRNTSTLNLSTNIIPTFSVGRRIITVVVIETNIYTRTNNQTTQTIYAIRMVLGIDTASSSNRKALRNTSTLNNSTNIILTFSVSFTSNYTEFPANTVRAALLARGTSRTGGRARSVSAICQAIAIIIQIVITYLNTNLTDSCRT
jgi:hypothetical protein